MKNIKNDSTEIFDLRQAFSDLKIEIVLKNKFNKTLAGIIDKDHLAFRVTSFKISSFDDDNGILTIKGLKMRDLDYDFKKPIRFIINYITERASICTEIRFYSSELCEFLYNELKEWENEKFILSLSKNELILYPPNK